MIIEVRRVKKDDSEHWLRMRAALWPYANADELRTEIDVQMHRPNANQCCLVAENREDGTLSGFLEVSIRSMADGCSSSPVGYIEGWYVEPAARGMGIGKRLVEAAEKWARLQGCSEIASDAEIENPLSIDIHKKFGFEEVSRVVTFRKAL